MGAQRDFSPPFAGHLSAGSTTDIKAHVFSYVLTAVGTHCTELKGLVINVNIATVDVVVLGLNRFSDGVK